jgi:hypothetical protein
LIIDGGELEDVYQLLSDLGVETLRLDPCVNLDVHQWPTRVLIAGVDRAEALREAASKPGCTAIGFTTDTSGDLGASARKAGFDYLVRRPVHPEALRLLIERVLYPGRERRDLPRLPAGCDVMWLAGLRAGHGTLVEISHGGCRILAKRKIALGTGLKIRLPRSHVGGFGLMLQGRVVRTRRPRAGIDGAVMAVAFTELGAPVRIRLDALLAEFKQGPAVQLVRECEQDGDAAVSLSAQEVASATQSAARMRPQPDASTLHRTSPRAEIQRKVISLDGKPGSVKQTLVGRDLSSGGMRVEPHPALSIGDCVRLAIYGRFSRDALVVEAEVVRDDGDRGLGLCFVNVDEDLGRHLDDLVADALSIEALRAAGPEGVLITQILSGNTLKEFQPDSHLTALYAGLGEHFGDLEKLEGAVLDLAASGCSVERLLTVIPEPKLEIHRTLESLLERGLIRVDSPDPS